MKSTFALTVPQDLYDATCEATDQGFADSLLYGAHLRGKNLVPRTLTAAKCLKGDSRFRDLAKLLEITVIEPAPYPGEGDRLSAKQAKDSQSWV